MKSMIASIVIAAMSLALSGSVVGCSASGSIEPDHTSTSRSGMDSSYKKTEVRDANGNVVESKVETKRSN